MEILEPHACSMLLAQVHSMSQMKKKTEKHVMIQSCCVKKGYSAIYTIYCRYLGVLDTFNKAITIFCHHV